MTKAPIAVETLAEKTLRLFNNSSKVVYVLVSESKYWNSEAQRWLAMFVCRYLRDNLDKSELCAVGSNGDWEHKDIKHIQYEAFTAQVQSDDLIVLSCSHCCKRSHDLQLRFKLCIDYTSYATDPGKVSYSYSDQDIESIRKLSAILSSSDSRLELLRILYSRISGDISLLKPAPFRIYNHPSLFANLYPKGLYIDAGAYDGSESKWLKSIMPEGSRVVSFEFDQKNYSKYLANNTEDGIEYIHAGLWSHEAIASTSGQGIGARVSVAESTSSSDSCLARLCSLDDYLSKNYNAAIVAFIKMDIEGAEIEALHGARRLIARDKPHLAISVYHKPSDLWEIPLLIYSIDKTYQFHIAQHASLLSETVLYCC